MKPRQRRWVCLPPRSLSLLVVGGVLGGLALASQPATAPARPAAGKPHRVVTVPKRLRTNSPLGAYRLLKDSVPTDHCVVEAPRVDDKFSVAAPDVDDACFVQPRVVGLPVGER